MEDAWVLHSLLELHPSELVVQKTLEFGACGLLGTIAKKSYFISFCSWLAQWTRSPHKPLQTERHSMKSDLCTNLRKKKKKASLMLWQNRKEILSDISFTWRTSFLPRPLCDRSHQAVLALPWAPWKRQRGFIIHEKKKNNIYIHTVCYSNTGDAIYLLEALV